MTEPVPTVFVIGAGVVGTTLAGGLRRAGVPLTGLHGRRAATTVTAEPGDDPLGGLVVTTGALPDAVSDADVVMICVRDDRVGDVVDGLVRERRLRAHQVLLHTSGAHAAADLLSAARPTVRGVGTMHPLVSFADPRLAAERLHAIAFGLEGDPTARAAARSLVGKLGARAVEIAAADLPLYHAGAVLVSNYVVALAELARSLLISAGIPAAEALPALIPLMNSVVQNLGQVGLPGALTGPVERGDVSTVERHLEALGRRAPAVVPLYRLLGREVLRIALSKSPLDADVISRLGALFGGGAPG